MVSQHTPTENTQRCGCYAIDRDEGKPYTIFHCPLHAQAPAMLDFTKSLVRRLTRHVTLTVCEQGILADARAILRAIEGDKS